MRGDSVRSSTDFESRVLLCVAHVFLCKRISLQILLILAMKVVLLDVTPSYLLSTWRQCEKLRQERHYRQCIYGT
jgi:hypothetical protein